MLIVFRADISHKIGSGHLRRCQSLARAFAKLGAKIIFLIRSDNPEAILSQEKEFEIIFLKEKNKCKNLGKFDNPHSHWLEVSCEDDAEDALIAIGNRKVAVVIVDHYSLDARWHKIISSELFCKIIAIDDLADRPLEVDLIVDHNYCKSHSEKYALVNKSAAPIIGGPGYALIDRSFQSAKKNPANKVVKSIGIFMGGVDTQNFSLRVLYGLRNEAAYAGEVEIVTTSYNPNLEELIENAQSDGRCKVTIDLPNLAHFYGTHELHIGAGGVATWERCCVGAPTLALIIAENQKDVLLPLASMNVIFSLDELNPDFKKIGIASSNLILDYQLRQKLSRNSIQLVDGLGCERVVERILKIC